jgi:hypothetical protein
MNNYKDKGFVFVITILFVLVSPSFLTAQTKDVAVMIHLRGVYESKVDLLSLSGTKQFNLNNSG